MDHPSGWMAVCDSESAKPRDEKIYARDEAFDGKTIHVIGLYMAAPRSTPG